MSYADAQHQVILVSILDIGCALGHKLAPNHDNAEVSFMHEPPQSLHLLRRRGIDLFGPCLPVHRWEASFRHFKAGVSFGLGWFTRERCEHTTLQRIHVHVHDLASCMLFHPCAGYGVQMRSN